MKDHISEWKWNRSVSLHEPKLAGDYQVLVVDPPWNQGKTGKRSVRPNQDTKLGYPTMSKSDLEKLPVSDWAADQSFLGIRNS